jgi:putative heme-binding domain-containing protein
MTRRLSTLSIGSLAGSLRSLTGAVLAVGAATLLSPRPAASAEPRFVLEAGDHVVTIGNTLADRMQHDGWLETYLHAHYPELELTFRNLGFAGDQIADRQRSENFGDPDQWLTKCGADVVLCFFGYNEALRGAAHLPQFETELTTMIQSMRAQQYNGVSSPRLVVFSPIAHEDLQSPHLPDGKRNNELLARYTSAMQRVCQQEGVPFVDLYHATGELYRQHAEPLTINGIHLSELGNRLVAEHILQQLTGAAPPQPAWLAKLREAVLEKNYYWFSRYRVVDGYNVYGGRSKLAWHGQSNADVMRREMEVFDVMTANRDKRVWAIAQGGDLEVVDDNLPPLLAVKTNKPGPLADESFPYLDGTEAIEQMTVAAGMEANLFASEQEFPRLVNPVQMAVDTDSRLWVSVWPSYPHWNPTQPRRDALLILPDEDGDGKADECIVFADELNSITGFEFWGGGVLVAAPPELWFLKDTDGDDKADVKIRILQGVSSADTHHSANALVIGPDGWLYWSRGIFNVASFETPTKTYRSAASGVHRFNPRTYEVEFHFPIGPNPHGDVFDRWGYQFANDGTSGQGSYVNIGKGVGNKTWFEKRVRPVAATGILSSSHFPEENEGNFLICNTIGVLGVLQHKVITTGADIQAVEIEPILTSSDQNFRPVDLEIGGDGALYVADWHNVLIGHMQHNMRDPNRDDEHGRIYRVTYPGRDLLQPAKLKGKPIAAVCEALFAKENGTRYRARLELSGRDSQEVAEAVGAFAASLDPSRVSPDRDEAQALLECLWIFAEHRLPNSNLVQKVFRAAEPRVRAAAIRTLGKWGPGVDDWESPLLAAARDPSPLVRAEAVKAAVSMEGLTAAEVVFEVAAGTLDPELETVLAYAVKQLDVQSIVREVVTSGRAVSPAARAYMLAHAGVDDLEKLEPEEAVSRAILSRPDASVSQLAAALTRLAEQVDREPFEVLLELIDQPQTGVARNVAGLGKLLVTRQDTPASQTLRRLQRLARDGKTAEVRRLAFAAWITFAGSEEPFLVASRSRESLQDFLEATPAVREDVRGILFEKILPLTTQLPPNLTADSEGNDLVQPGLKVECFYPHDGGVALKKFAKATPYATGHASDISCQLGLSPKPEQFALRFTGFLTIDEPGQYTFYTTSDDGSRLYIGNQQVVDNDGPHGMTEKSGTIELTAGSHPIVVTYGNISGDYGLQVAWQGPGGDKQPIPSHHLTTARSETLHDVAIAALASLPGREEDKFAAFASLLATGKSRPAAIRALGTLPERPWPLVAVRPLIDNLVGYVSSLPERLRTSDSAVEAIALAKSLSKALPAEEATSVSNRLESLDVQVIAIGTVPHRMIFDKEIIAVAAGEPVEFRFSNTDAMPHNFAIVQPGALQEVGELAESTGTLPDAMARQYIPKSDKILLASRLLQPGELQTLSFRAPEEPGVYPYVCTYPGHWRRMYGALHVVADLETYQGDPAAYLAAEGIAAEDELLEMTARNREWTFDELIEDVRAMPAGRSFEVGKQLFKAASCVGCHQLDGEGYVFGPDLAKLDEKKRTPEHVLRSLLEPSRDIDEAYRAHVFLMESGRTESGMIVEKSATEIQIMIDPLAKGTPTVLQIAEIEEQSPSEISPMPMGLLNRLNGEEILDLVAYVLAGGNREDAIYEGGHEHGEQHGHDEHHGHHEH